jgi:hypothetical protein
VAALEAENADLKAQLAAKEGDGASSSSDEEDS